MFESNYNEFFNTTESSAAVDIFRALQGAATSLKNNLMIFAAVAAVASIVLGGIFFFFGRRGAENGKMHVGLCIDGGRSYISCRLYCGFVIWNVWTNPTGTIKNK